MGFIIHMLESHLKKCVNFMLFYDALKYITFFFKRRKKKEGEF